MSADNLTKIRFALAAADQFAGESLWAQDVGSGIYRLRNIPFGVKGYAEGDLVRCVLRNGWQEVVSMERDSGNGTLWIEFTDAEEVENQRHVLDELTSVGCSYEWVTGRIVAITMSKTLEVPFSQLLNYLDIQIGKKVIAGWEIGKYPANSDYHP